MAVEERQQRYLLQSARHEAGHVVYSLVRGQPYASMILFHFRDPDGNVQVGHKDIVGLTQTASKLTGKRNRSANGFAGVVGECIYVLAESCRSRNLPMNELYQRCIDDASPEDLNDMNTVSPAWRHRAFDDAVRVLWLHRRELKRIADRASNEFVRDGHLKNWKEPYFLTLNSLGEI